ncbi:MAG: lipoprotein-releasing system ATP-binding protein LolD, partial [Treponema sp.]|nr:lipoprotein-releasing system ATP-binding protein LolD [Treponema sp.]
ALVKKPTLILADEPTANLDSKIGREILELMLELNKSEKTTFIFSTHDQMVMDYARRLVRIRDGQIESDEVKG